ncbi:predicted protein [Naegleria gruberi]|uniref:Predicted protein n=1 Tax=Naegleria gruberi TaxID=5762 RepID=D2VIK2_NAEGR|nr:uncharacterized protein NAEGRDRAFT_49832 [Naegleria gruberi]EFC43284.1 predicted protein [Naegleria gruberi]|eukprot:XP_002676028.1 predicted protein [Naegleria gruberi strain NEG-M]
MSEQNTKKNKPIKAKKSADKKLEQKTDEEIQDMITTTQSGDVMGEVEELDFPEDDFLKEIEEQFEMVSAQQASEAAESRKKNKVAITEEPVPKSDAELIMQSENSVKYQKAPVSFRVNIVRKTIKMVIILHKIPEKYIKLDVEDDHFTVDTLGYTRKLWLQRKFPGLIKVNKEKVAAQFLKNGLVLVTLPIVSIPKETFDHHLGLIKKKHESRKIKFPTPVKQSIIKSAINLEKKRKRRERQKEKKEFIAQNMDLKQKKKKKKKTNTTETTTAEQK